MLISFDLVFCNDLGNIFGNGDDNVVVVDLICVLCFVDDSNTDVGSDLGN